MANLDRYNKAITFLREKIKDNSNPSMRVFIQEDGEEAKVLDYDFFFAEKKVLEKFKK